MNQRLTELYRSCRPKEALASQDEYKSANVLLGSEVETFAETLIKDNIRNLVNNGYTDAAQCLQDIHFGIEDAP